MLPRPRNWSRSSVLQSINLTDVSQNSCTGFKLIDIIWACYTVTYILCAKSASVDRVVPNFFISLNFDSIKNLRGFVRTINVNVFIKGNFFEGGKLVDYIYWYLGLVSE